jgi:FKBP-type peptidyl-prolyl cis-trans isomerase
MRLSVWQTVAPVALLAVSASGCASSGGAPAAAAAQAASQSAAQSSEGGSPTRDLGVVDARVGTGARAALHQCLYVHYVGMLPNGQRFETSRDSAISRVQTPVVFELGTGTVMTGWEKGIGGMQVGGMRRLFVPYRMAYGAAGRPPAIPPRTDLVFDIELMAVTAPLPSSSNASRAESAPSCPVWGAVRGAR